MSRRRWSRWMHHITSWHWRLNSWRRSLLHSRCRCYCRGCLVVIVITIRTQRWLHIERESRTHLRHRSEGQSWLLHLSFYDIWIWWYYFYYLVLILRISHLSTRILYVEFEIEIMSNFNCIHGVSTSTVTDVTKLSSTHYFTIRRATKHRNHDHKPTNSRRTVPNPNTMGMSMGMVHS